MELSILKIHEGKVNRTLTFCFNLFFLSVLVHLTLLGIYLTISAEIWCANQGGADPAGRGGRTGGTSPSAQAPIIGAHVKWYI
jgi:hypothetical protein